MQHTIPVGLTQLTGLNTKEQTHILLQQVYPWLFQQLNQLSTSIASLEKELDTTLMNTVLLKMNEELDELYRKEKLVLYPFLLQLEAEHRQSDCCKPFKNVKAHYITLITASEQLKQELRTAISIHPSALLSAAWTTAQMLISAVIKVQIHKEKYLLARFRSCTGNCKSIGHE